MTRQEARTPPLFGDATARRCTRRIGGRNCEAEPIVHVAWNLDEEGCDAGFVCADHVGELGSRWSFLQAHEIGHDCGMPGAIWDFDANVCRYEDGLPTAQAKREAREAVPA